MRPLRHAIAAAVAGSLTLALTLTGCGSGGETAVPAASGSSASPAGFPVTVRGSNGPVTLPARPTRIVSLSPTATEILYAVGAGQQVVAVDDQSDHPPQAPRTALSGFKPNAEAVLKYEPDLVVVSDDLSKIVSTLTSVKVPVLLQSAPTDLDGAYAQIVELGAAAGHRAEAERLTERMRTRIAAAIDKAVKPTEPLTFYHEIDNGLYSVTSATFIGQLYGLFGLRNIADEADKQRTGYPKLSAEYIVRADPDLIFLADTECCGQSAATLAKRPAWNRIGALRTGGVVELDDDIASRWGPRVVDYVETISAAVAAAVDRANGGA